MVEILSSEISNNELTEAEAELYDRQIRLWGLESQKRLRGSKILLAGLNGLGAEIAKNIILSGVKQVTFLDSSKVQDTDFCSQFFLSRTSIGENRADASLIRAQALNPMVEIKVDKSNLSEKSDDFFHGFDVICILEAPMEELLRIDKICREQKIKFFAADLWGMFGFSFADLQVHEFVEDVVKHKIISAPHEKTKTELVTSTAKRTLTFPSLDSAINFDYKSPAFVKRMKKTGPAYIVMKILQKFRETEKRDPQPDKRAQDTEKLLKNRDELSSADVVPNDHFEHVFSQISPAAAIVGGAVAQEIIKTVSQKEAPHHNFFFFDPDSSCGFIESIE